jgi:shikimate dehydrogenase
VTARAVAVALARAGVKRLQVGNRNPAPAPIFVALLNQKTPTHAEFFHGAHTLWDAVDIVITSLPLGFTSTSTLRSRPRSNRTKHDRCGHHSKLTPNTHLTAAANGRRCTVPDGLGMLVNQSVIGIGHCTGIAGGAAVMRDTAQAIFAAAGSFCILSSELFRICTPRHKCRAGLNAERLVRCRWCSGQGGSISAKADGYG